MGLVDLVAETLRNMVAAGSLSIEETRIDVYRLGPGFTGYASLVEKTAALLHSLARNHALVDGDKRLALAATIAFLGLNGRRLTLSNDQAYELVMSVAAGELDDIANIAGQLDDGTEPR